MKNHILYALIPIIALLSCNKDDEKNNNFKDVSLSMGSGLVYDVFYSFKDGEVTKVKRSDWDIALSVSMRTASVRINEGSGVELYPAGGVADWTTIDSINVNPTTRIWNDETDWLKGAFNRGAGTPKAFSYGWGTYNDISHDVVADSVYIIKLTSGDFKKIKLFKSGMKNSYTITWANLDETGLDSATIDLSTAAAKNYVYYSISKKQTINYEPDNTAWDILLTYYTERISAGPGVFMDYQVMGILTNQGYQVAKVTDKSPESSSLSDSTSGFQKASNSIGWDWKTPVGQTGNYTLTDKLSYFVKNPNGSIYQLYFKTYEGKSTGNIAFKTQFIE